MKTITATELKSILASNKLWIESEGKEGTRPNLTGAILTGANLYRANLNGASLHSADLRGANLTGASLWGASLVGADLNGASLTDAHLGGANLTVENLTGANLTGANLEDTNLTGAIGLPYVSWIIPGCLAQLNHIKYGFWLEKENKDENFIQDSLGFFIQDNLGKKTFDMLVGDRIIRNIPDWVKYSGMKKIV